MSATDYIYPYDPSGSLASNKIISEAIDVSVPSNSTDASFVIFRASPFFANTLVVSTSIGNGTTLIEGVDYILTHQFHGATDALSRPVYGGIQFLNHTYAGRVYASYQSLGGDHTLDSTSIAEELTRDYYSIRTMTWDQLKPQIAGFPPYGHDHTANNLVGLGELIDSTDRIAAAIEDSASGNTGGGSDTGTGSASLSAHISATQNAHSKAAVQLGNVENFSIATVNDLANSAPNKYVTAGLLRQAFNIYNTDISSFVSRINIIENAQSEFSEYRTNVNGQLLAINNTFTNYNTIFNELEDNVEAVTRTVAINNHSLLEMQFSVNAVNESLQAYTIRLNAFAIDLEKLQLTDALRGEALGILYARVTELGSLSYEAGHLPKVRVKTSEHNELPELPDVIRDPLGQIYSLVGSHSPGLKRINGAYLGRMTARFASTVGGVSLFHEPDGRNYNYPRRYEKMISLGLSDFKVTSIDGSFPLSHTLVLSELSPKGFESIQNIGELPVTLKLEGSLTTQSLTEYWSHMAKVPPVINIGTSAVTMRNGEPYSRTTVVADTYTGTSKLLEISPTIHLALNVAPNLEYLDSEDRIVGIEPTTLTWSAGLQHFDGKVQLPPAGIIDTANAANAWTSDWVSTAPKNGMMVKLPDDCVYFAVHLITADSNDVHTPSETVFRGGGWHFIVLDSWLVDILDARFAVSYRTRDSTTRPELYLGPTPLRTTSTNTLFKAEVTIQPEERLQLGLLTSYEFTGDATVPELEHELGRFVSITDGSVTALVDISETLNSFATRVRVVPEEPEGDE